MQNNTKPYSHLLLVHPRPLSLPLSARHTKALRQAAPHTCLALQKFFLSPMMWPPAGGKWLKSCRGAHKELETGLET